jgi:hypothetical protein
MSFLAFFRRKKGGRAYTYYSSQNNPGPSSLSRESLGRLEQKAEEPFDARKHKDTKRAQIALIFVRSYVWIVVIIIVGIPLYNWAVGQPKGLEIDATLAQLGALIGSPLGFVVGYYFKEDKE